LSNHFLTLPRTFVQTKVYLPHTLVWGIKKNTVQKKMIFNGVIL